MWIDGSAHPKTRVSYLPGASKPARKKSKANFPLEMQNEQFTHNNMDSPPPEGSELTLIDLILNRLSR